MNLYVQHTRLIDVVRIPFGFRETPCLCSDPVFRNGPAGGEAHCLPAACYLEVSPVVGTTGVLP